MAAQLALLLGVPVSSRLLFAVIAAAGATSVLSFAVLARYFPKEVAGRANAALGVLNMGAAFALQSLAGFIIALWPASEGRYPVEAHQAALAIGLALQLAALLWFAAPRDRPVLSMQRAVQRIAIAAQPRLGAIPQHAVPYPAIVQIAPAQRQVARCAGARHLRQSSCLRHLPAGGSRRGQRQFVEAARNPAGADPPPRTTSSTRPIEPSNRDVLQI
jgi:MFS family permease